VRDVAAPRPTSCAAAAVIHARHVADVLFDVQAVVDDFTGRRRHRAAHHTATGALQPQRSATAAAQLPRHVTSSPRQARPTAVCRQRRTTGRLDQLSRTKCCVHSLRIAIKLWCWNLGAISLINPIFSLKWCILMNFRTTCRACRNNFSQRCPFGELRRLGRNFASKQSVCNAAYAYHSVTYLQMPLTFTAAAVSAHTVISNGV